MKAECAGNWASENVVHTRGVACAGHPTENVVQGLFLFFKWISSEKLDWMTRVINPLSSRLELSGKFEVRYVTQFISEDYTTYEMVWTYLFLTVTLVVGFLYCSGLRKLGVCPEWRYEQISVVVLLGGLVLFNNPLFITVTNTAVSEDEKEAMQFMHVVTALMFVCVLLFVLLCMLHEMADKLNQRHWAKFYLPKVLLTLGLWTTMLAGFINLISSDQNHLTFDGPGDEDKHYIVLILMCVFLFLYLIWVLAVAFFAGYNMVSYLPARQFVFVFVVVIITIFTSIATLISSYFTVSAIQFVFLYGEVNLFVWTLAFCFSAVQVKDKSALSGKRYFHDASDQELWAITNLGLPQLPGVRVAVAVSELDERQIDYDSDHDQEGSSML
eukprot:TRINITY_DN2641_c0_g1_i7.p1 TRINITY_DN2641_c0_g1~~TRINITY_DN2641_c0_g1_i7.p1  ORF type:complete len:385 (-),score=94.71 TRINITY_DN2641_c0_g1_i7:264-1418(-)